MAPALRCLSSLPLSSSESIIGFFLFYVTTRAQWLARAKEGKNNNTRPRIDKCHRELFPLWFAPGWVRTRWAVLLFLPRQVRTKGKRRTRACSDPDKSEPRGTRTPHIMSTVHTPSATKIKSLSKTCTSLTIYYYMIRFAIAFSLPRGYKWHGQWLWRFLVFGR